MTEQDRPDMSSSPALHIFLVVVDDSEEMHAALRYACNQARITGAKVALLRVITPVESQHFAAIGDLMEKEARDGAEALLHKLAGTVNQLSGQLPALYVREGSNPYDALLALIGEESQISLLVLAAGTEPGGPGPLVSALTGKHVNRLKVPMTIVPGGLTDEEIDILS